MENVESSFGPVDRIGQLTMRLLDIQDSRAKLELYGRAGLTHAEGPLDVRGDEAGAGLGGRDVASLGIPTQDEAVKLYCDLTGRDGIPALDWYFSYNAFRLACILQGIAGRVRDGTAASAHATQMIQRIRPLAAASFHYAQKAGLK